MNYRVSRPSDIGCDTDDEEFDDMRFDVQSFMQRMDPNDICDTILIVAKACEHRAHAMMPDHPLFNFYTRVSHVTRQLLEQNTSFGPLPNIKLENDALYFPDMEQTH